MKKILLNVASIGLLATLFLPLIVLAQWGGVGDAEAPVTAPTWGEVDVIDALGRISNWLFAILLIVAAIFLIVAGYFFVTARGDTDKVTTARQFVLWALIGVLVGFLAKGLVMLVNKMVRG